MTHKPRLQLLRHLHLNSPKVGKKSPGTQEKLGLGIGDKPRTLTQGCLPCQRCNAYGKKQNHCVKGRTGHT